MAHFDLSKLNADLNRLVPTRSDMDTLVGAFKDTVPVLRSDGGPRAS